MTRPLEPEDRDVVWETIREEAALEATREPVLGGFLHATILTHLTLEDALSFHLASKLGDPVLPSMLVREIMASAFASDGIRSAIRADLRGVRERDPASAGYSVPLLHYKGFHALESHRVASWLWQQGRTHLAYCFQNRVSEVFGVDIHPAARIGSGIFIDHGTGIVVGETAVIDDNVSMLQGVTLGGTGNERGDRHPKIRSNVLLGAGAKVLGNIEIGVGARIGANSVVLASVPPGATAVGVPARVVSYNTAAHPALDMDHTIAPLDEA